jgi:hypothetical protein
VTTDLAARMASARVAVQAAEIAVTQAARRAMTVWQLAGLLPLADALRQADATYDAARMAYHEARRPTRDPVTPPNDGTPDMGKGE